MGTYSTNKEYIFLLDFNENNCTYRIFDSEWKLLSSAFTPQEPFHYDTPSYFFSNYFGGDYPASQEVTISYTKNLNCTDPRKFFA